MGLDRGIMLFIEALNGAKFSTPKLCRFELGRPLSVRSTTISAGQCFLAISDKTKRSSISNPYDVNDWVSELNENVDPEKKEDLRC